MLISRFSLDASHCCQGTLSARNDPHELTFSNSGVNWHPITMTRRTHNLAAQLVIALSGSHGCAAFSTFTIAAPAILRTTVHLKPQRDLNQETVLPIADTIGEECTSTVIG